MEKHIKMLSNTKQNRRLAEIFGVGKNNQPADKKRKLKVFRMFDNKVTRFLM